MRHNHNLLNILLPTIIIGSYFSYFRHSSIRYQNNLENKINENYSLQLEQIKLDNCNKCNIFKFYPTTTTLKYASPNNYNFNSLYTKRENNRMKSTNIYYKYLINPNNPNNP